jgi:hypothetical protein
VCVCVCVCVGVGVCVAVRMCVWVGVATSCSLHPFPCGLLFDEAAQPRRQGAVKHTTRKGEERRADCVRRGEPLRDERNE